MKNKNLSGFTLLETLLVIAMIAILVSYGLNYYSQRTNALKIAKTAQQIQNILLAASTYYIRNNQWPTACTTTDFQTYLPVGTLNNPWLSTYHCAPTQAGKKFQVMLTDLNTNIAQRIATILPNATSSCVNNQCTVLAEEAIPAQQSSLQTNFLVKTIGESNPMQDGDKLTIPSFTCPEGWSGNAEIMLSQLRANSSNYVELTCIPAITTATIAELSNNLNCQRSGNTYQCSSSLTANYRAKKDQGWNKCLNFYTENYGLVNFVYIGFCTKNTSTSKI